MTHRFPPLAPQMPQPRRPPQGLVLALPVLPYGEWLVFTAFGLALALA